MRIRIRKKYLFYFLLVISSVIAAAGTSLDSVISYFYIKNPWVFGVSIFLVGVLITLLLSLLLSIPAGGKSIGSRIDPSFRRVRLIRKSEVSTPLRYCHSFRS